MKSEDLWQLEKVFTLVGERLREHDRLLAELREQIERLKGEPRASLAQRLRSKGQPR